ncbi:MAG: hypothetical protein J6S83_01725 [Lachnospiraceae bacterium]|nr:hypothetical protein [Lachnospiraceae bacterium]
MNRYLNLADRFGGDLKSLDDLGRMPEDQLRIPKEDVEILRELAKRKHEAACLDVMDERRKLWTAANDMKMIKPPIYVDEICWPEMNPDGELTLHCKHWFAQEIEEILRHELYCHDHGLGDIIVEDYIESPLVVYDSGFGIDEVVDIRRTDRNSEVVSRHFHILIKDMDDIHLIHEPEIHLDMERTYQYTEVLKEIFEDILPVKIVGARGLWFTPFDYLIRVLGIQETMINLYDEPEFVEAVVKRYVDCCMIRMEKYRELGIWASNNSSCRVGSGGYGLVSCLDEREKAPTHCDTMQMWGCGNAQIFTTVSPEMHMQFSLQYEMEWLKQFGLNYYGCCEPLYHKMDLMDQIPRLRKVSMSPWNKFDLAAERCRGKYVMSCKPAPSIFAVGELNEDVARADLRRILDQTEGCSLEIVMKDISTVDYKPQKLWRWAQIAREEIDRKYN